LVGKSVIATIIDVAPAVKKHQQQQQQKRK
jgi:hypothetical protein